MNPHTPQPYVTLVTPEWAKNAAIYQINTRQFTAQGTFKAAEEKLDYLRDLGVKILWLMPIHPIGEENRKGTLGSPYSVKDYYGVNPEFGTAEDLKDLVRSAHQRGLKVILDAVLNHSAWDNHLRDQHPDWYARNWDGNFRPTPWWDWSDIIDLDYSSAALREYMTDAMTYWVRELDIDGYRMDVAGFVPWQFWNHLRTELEAIKPVFMLAEWESRDLHQQAFDMTYAWSWHKAIREVVEEGATLKSLFTYYSWNEASFPREAYRMTYVANHDSNAWEGTAQDVFGDAMYAVFALSVLGEGMPLVYNGLDAEYNKALEFFERDPIRWRYGTKMQELAKSLLGLLRDNQALWHGIHGGRMIPVVNSVPERVLTFVRRKHDDEVFALFNLHREPHEFSLRDSLVHKTYRNFLTGETIAFRAGESVTLQPWEFLIAVQ